MADENMSFKIKEEWQHEDNDPCDPLNIATICNLKEEIKTEPESSHQAVDDIQFAQCWIKAEENEILDIPVQSELEARTTTPAFIGENIALESKPFVCPSCSSAFATKKLLADHLTTHGSGHNKLRGKKSLKRSCEICGKVLKNKNNLKTHMLIHNNEKKFSCIYCQKCFLRKVGLQNHMLTHTTFKPYKCDICNQGFKQENNLNKHLIIHKGKKKLQCTICQKFFVSKYYLKVHIANHAKHFLNSKPEKKLKTCKKNKSTKKLLTLINLEPYKCEICGKEFKFKSNLTQHRRIHNSVRSLECSTCQLQFMQKRTLKNHMLTHTNAKPYICKTCDRAFTFERYLTKHAVTHNPVKEIQCTICNKLFLRKEALKKHSFIHRTVSDFHDCQACGKKFKLKSYLKKHMQIHEG